MKTFKDGLRAAADVVLAIGKENYKAVKYYEKSGGDPMTANAFGVAAMECEVILEMLLKIIEEISDE